MATEPQNLPIQQGDTWACVTKHGRGQPVKVLKVTVQNVQFRASGRGNLDEKVHTLATELFRIRYRPLSLVAPRQRELVLEEQRNGAPLLAEPRQVVLPQLPDGSPAPMGTAFTQGLAAADAPAQRRKRRQLTPAQILEIHELMKGAPEGQAARGEFRREVAQTYGILPQSVYDIERGKAYSWVTGQEHLPGRRSQLWAAQQQQQQQTDTVAVDEDITVPDQGKQETMQQPQESVQPTNDTATDPERQLLVDLADAVELLIAHRKQTLSRFVTLDLVGIEGLAARARALGRG